MALLSGAFTYQPPGGTHTRFPTPATLLIALSMTEDDGTPIIKREQLEAAPRGINSLLQAFVVLSYPQLITDNPFESQNFLDLTMVTGPGLPGWGPAFLLLSAVTKNAETGATVIPSDGWMPAALAICAPILSFPNFIITSAAPATAASGMYPPQGLIDA
jgi:hypothetical protein